jgi:radical SAM protein with 4Fe4S-binding SPASM domain
MDPKKKFYLFKQSENFCSVPWNYLKINMDGAVNTCVNGSSPLGNIHSDSIDDLIASPTLKSIKQNSYNNIEDSNCRRCLTFEHSQGVDYQYLRGLYNSMFVKTPVDYSDPEDFKLAGLDLHWGSTCNLKCITCWAKQSSAIAQEQGVPILNVSTQAADSLIDYVIDHQEHLKEIYLSGGEPTLIKHNLRLLQRLNKDTDCEIRINTNMMFDLDNQIINELKKFPNVLFTISADSSVPERFNYIRRGASWDKFMANLDALMPLHFRWRVNSVFFVGSAMTLADTQQYFMDRFGITDFTINQMFMDHMTMRARNLPATVKADVQARLLAHREKYSNNSNLSGQIVNCLKELEQVGSDDYKPYFDNIDSIAGTNWRRVFAELV